MCSETAAAITLWDSLLIRNATDSGLWHEAVSFHSLEITGEVSNEILRARNRGC